MEITKQENQQIREFIRQKVIEHNKSSLPEQQDKAHGNVSYVARNEAGDIVGGVTGTYFWQHMHIDFLWVDPSQQRNGIASDLVEKIEHYSQELECRMITLDTFSFQAPEFYRKQGFREFGVLEDHPAGHSHHYFVKRLAE